ncbi:hypothetical protein VNI00_014747 [Paramarasmius palmivorus]|uniref:Uncharacterized protein n=1 Tax=Paramarasmius palmivorus TaxID=297713 RepID=A0AAW0BQL4_9AGAR
MADTKSPQDCISDLLYEELLHNTDTHILAGLDLDIAHIRYHELKDQQKVIEWELKKLEREWRALAESHATADVCLKETCSRVVDEGGRRGDKLVKAVQKQRYTSFVDLPQYTPVKSRLLVSGVPFSS